MSRRPEQAFRLAASELGMASAAWLFASEVAAASGDDAVAELRDALGRTWPVLDAVCAGWLEGSRPPQVDPRPLLPLVDTASRLVLVGHEALWLDALLPHLPRSLRVGLVMGSELAPDWGRVAANHGGRLELLELGAFQAWGGARSLLLSFTYGASPHGEAFVLPTWLRISGPDVRTQFRALVGWEVLHLPMLVYPRWLVPGGEDRFTHVVTA